MFKKLFIKKQLYTIPNLLSLFRILLIPVILISYNIIESNIITVFILITSGITDILDGFIARKFNMISDVGKILDPIADKLTQLSMIVSLSLKYNLMFYLILLFLIKESLMLLMGYNALKLNSINSARWHGKVNTFSLYFVISILLVFSNINTKTANIFIIINICLMILSLILYICFYYNKIKEVKIY